MENFMPIADVASMLVSLSIRVLFMGILLFALAPLGSIYVLFVSLKFPMESSGNTTTEDAIWDIVLKTHGGTNTTTMAELVNGVLSMSDVNNQNLQHLHQQSLVHLRILLPWIFGAILGFLIPIFMVCKRQNNRHRNPKRIRKMISAALDCSIVRNEDGICGICLETLQDNVAIGTCRHAFHEYCISNWLCRRKSHYQCPMCRQDFLNPNVTRELRMIR